MNLLFIRTNIGENINWFNDFHVHLSLFGGSSLNDLTECHSIQRIYWPRDLNFDSGSSGSIIHQWKFSKCITMFISFKILAFSINNLIAIVLSWFYDKKRISIFTFFNNGLIFDCDFFFHGTNQGVFIFVINVLEKNWVSDQTYDQEFSLLRLRKVLYLEAFFFVKTAEYFFGNTHSATSLSLCFFFFKFRVIERQFLTIIFWLWFMLGSFYFCWDYL